MTFLSRLIASIIIVVICTASAQAAKRVALVIGNSQYEHVSNLANPTNDADDIGSALSKIGFDVTKLKDLSYQNMRLALRAFSDKALGSNIALVYYAGHGIEVDKHNYLVPTDARLKKDIDIRYEAMPLDLINDAVAGAKNLRLILLDACRDNPFTKSMTRTLSTRSIGRGLARIEPTVGTLVSYAAKEGTVAADGDDRNSPYTKALIRHLGEEGLEIQFMFRKVRDSVIAITGGRQEPFTYGSLPGKRIFLNPTEKKPEAKPSTRKPAHKTNNSAEIIFWDGIKNSRNNGYFEAYLNRYPKGIYSELARIKIEEIKIAAIDPNQFIPKLEQPKTVNPAQGRELVRNVQRQLNRVGCSAGKADGIWGTGSARALRNFRTHTKTKMDSLEPSNNLLGKLKAQKARVCPLTCRRGFELSEGRCKRIATKAALDPKPTTTRKLSNTGRIKNIKRTVNNRQCFSCPALTHKPAATVCFGSRIPGWVFSESCKKTN